MKHLKEWLLAEDNTVLLQIGGGASVRAKVLEPEKVLVAIGAEVVVERSNKDAVEFLKERIMEMEASQKKVSETLDRLRSQMNEINKTARERVPAVHGRAAGRGITESFLMFGGLKERLQAARNRLSSSIGAVVAPPAAEPVVTPPVPAAAFSRPGKNGSPEFC